MKPLRTIRAIVIKQEEPSIYIELEGGGRLGLIGKWEEVRRCDCVLGLEYCYESCPRTIENDDDATGFK